METCNNISMCNNMVSMEGYPVDLKVSSSGPAGTDNSDRMGVYLYDDSQLYNNRPVYQLDRGEEYLYYNDGGYWAIGPTVGGVLFGIATLQQGLLTPPSTGWRYADENDQWKNDPQLTVSG